MKNMTEFKSQDKSLRKQMVIDAAVKVFHQKGYRMATLDDVADILGLTKPALYHYVSSKENLLSQIYLQALESFFATIYEIRNMDLSPPEKLRLFIQRHLKKIVVENLAMFSVFFSEENQLPEKDYQKIRTEKRKFNQVVEDIIEEGIGQGHFREVNAKLLANAIIGMCNWLYQWYIPGKSSFTPDEIADQFISLIENGLKEASNETFERDGIVYLSSGSKNWEDRDARKNRLLQELKILTSKMTSLADELEKM